MGKRLSVTDMAWEMIDRTDAYIAAVAARYDTYFAAYDNGLEFDGPDCD